MGGHHRGDVAAALAVESIRSISDHTPSRTELLEAVRLAHDAITLVGQEQASEGMGTTLCGLATTSEGSGESLLVFNVGDSRVYRFEHGSLEQVTRDHSVVQELIDDGTISTTEASTHPERHVITRSLGSGGPLEIDWWSIDPVAGDRYLLCSDGLVKELPEAAIADVLSEVEASQAAVDRLMIEALAAGGRDNVTIVVVDVVATSPIEELAATEPETQPRTVAVTTSPSDATAIGAVPIDTARTTTFDGPHTDESHR
jgi:protein phosphatase